MASGGNGAHTGHGRLPTEGQLSKDLVAVMREARRPEGKDVLSRGNSSPKGSEHCHA